MWFAISTVLAFFIWLIATTTANPIEERGFSRIPVQIDVPAGLILTNEPTRNVRVDVRAQQSILNRLTADDIIVRADMSMTQPGQYIVPLIVDIARTANADTQPTQITVYLEQVITQQKPVQINVLNPPAADIDHNDPVPDALQVQVSGASNRVSEIVAVRGDIDLSQQRASFEADIPLIAVNADGETIDGVTVTPRTTRVTVALIQREDVQQLPIRPNLLVTTLPPNYRLESIRYEPQTIFISGSPIALRAVGSALDTEPINLAGRTETFTINVPLALPSDELIILSEDNFVTVTVGISPQTSVLQIDDVPVTIIGLDPIYTAQISPPSISVLLSGAIGELDGLTSADLEAVVDVNNLTVGTHELIPAIVVKQRQVNIDTKTPLPSSVNVSILTVQPETTPEATPETTP